MNKNGRKVVPLPGLYGRFAKKGTDKLKEACFEEAKEYFQQALDIEPSGERANYGFTLCLLKLGQLHEAREHCEKLLAEGFEDYYELLQIYVSVLIKLKAYEEARMLIEALLQERNIPTDAVETFHRLLDYCRNRTDEDLPLFSRSSEGGRHPQKLLESNDTEEQLAAVRYLRANDSVRHLQAYQKFLSEKNGDPIVKTMIIQQLKEKNIDGVFLVRKFDSEVQVDLQHTEDVFSDRFSRDVKKVLDEQLGQNNPSLFEMALEIWRHFVFAVYPLQIEPAIEQVWAAAVHQVVHHMAGIDIKDEQVAAFYGVSIHDLEQAAERLNRVEGIAR